MYAKISDITLTQDTIYTNEWDFTPVPQMVKPTVQGNVVIEVINPVSYSGRPMTLQLGWINAQTLRYLTALRDTYDQKARITRLCDGREFTTVFNHAMGNPLQVASIVPRPDHFNQVSPDWYDATLNLLQGEISDTTSFSYGTFNPSDKDGNITLSNGDLTVESTLIGLRSVRSTFSKNDDGTAYAEFTIDADPVGDGEIVIGIGNPSANLATYAGADTNSYGYYGADGKKLYDGGSETMGDTYTVGDKIQMAYDMNNGNLWFGKNGTWVGDPVGRSDPAFTSISGDMHIMISIGRVGNEVTANFGATILEYMFPQGFLPGLIEEA